MNLYAELSVKKMCIKKKWSYWVQISIKFVKVQSVQVKKDTWHAIEADALINLSSDEDFIHRIS